MIQFLQTFLFHFLRNFCMNEIMNKWILAAVIGSSIGYNVYQSTQIGKLSVINNASLARENINDDNFREAFIATSQKNDLEFARSQGRIEGILLVTTKQKPEESDYSQIWHDGYYRGLEQAKDTKEILKNSIDPNDEKGYTNKEEKTVKN